MARILSTSYVHVHVHTRTVNVCAMVMISYVILKYAPYDWLKCNPRLQKKNRGRVRVHTILFCDPFSIVRRFFPNAVTVRFLWRNSPIEKMFFNEIKAIACMNNLDVPVAM